MPFPKEIAKAKEKEKKDQDARNTSILPSDQLPLEWIEILFRAKDIPGIDRASPVKDDHEKAKKDENDPGNRMGNISVYLLPKESKWQCPALKETRPWSLDLIIEDREDEEGDKVAKGIKKEKHPGL